MAAPPTSLEEAPADRTGVPPGGAFEQRRGRAGGVGPQRRPEPGSAPGERRPQEQESNEPRRQGIWDGRMGRLASAIIVRENRKRKTVLVRMLFGGAAALLPVLVSIAMAPTRRSPYLMAYPAVIISAWLWDLPGAVACAAVSGLLIERYMFLQHRLSLSPDPSAWVFREVVFLLGSVLAGALTRFAAAQRTRIVTERLEQKLALVETEQRLAVERQRALELARENEARTYLALDGANVGLWEWDMDNGISEWSNGFRRLHGLTDVVPPSYEVWRLCVHPEDRARVEAELNHAVATETEFLSEYRVALPNEEVRWLVCQGRIYYGDGGPRRMSGYSGDVTRRKLADLALLQNEKLAVAGRLSAAIAHEVNNPLEAVMNLLYLLQNEPMGAEAAEYVRQAVEQLKRVAQITQQTLRFSRTSRKPSVCRPSEILRATQELLRARLSVLGIEVRTELRDDPEFLCASGEMQQILTNLLTNAMEAMAHGGVVRVRAVSCREWTGEGRRGVRFTVADRGCGMTADVLRQMQEPFFTTKDGTGTGLGMWVVKQLAHHHQGRLLVRSSVRAERHGTVFQLFVPFGLDAEALSTI